ncbi:MAG: lysylphosphatidylglycerol synthase transmembrane domain-containing protein [Candidatus Dormibacteria bacterium]
MNFATTRRLGGQDHRAATRAAVMEMVMQAAMGARNVSVPRRGARRLAARALPAVAALGGVGALVGLVNPRSVAGALGRFDASTLLPLFLLVLLFYLLQGMRWHLLLRAVGVVEDIADTQLINLAGQTLTAVPPLGDLTRALLVSRRSGVELGAAAATVTIQELTFTLLVVAAAAPGLARLPHGALWMLAVVLGICAVIAILTVPRLFDVVHRWASATPGLRRFAGDIDTLHREVCRLLGRADVLAGAVLDLGRVITATAALLLVLRGLGIDSLGWWDGALVLAVSFVGGALSLLPGGMGANEATVVGILMVLGVNPAAAAAAAIVQRLSLTLVPTAGGALAYLALRRRQRVTRASCPAPADRSLRGRPGARLVGSRCRGFS